MCKSSRPKPSKEQKRLMRKQEQLIDLQRQQILDAEAANAELLANQQAEAEQLQQEANITAAKQRQRKTGNAGNFFSGPSPNATSGGGEATSLLRRVV